MAASEVPSEPRTRESGPRRVAVTAVDLPGGAKIEFSFTGDIFGLSAESADFVFGVVKQMKAFAATLPVGPAPSVAKSPAAPKAPKAPALGEPKLSLSCSSDKHTGADFCQILGRATAPEEL